MSDTPKQADDCQKLLDNGFTIAMFKSDLGSYTAVALKPNEPANFLLSEIVEFPGIDERLTDDFLPSQALYRLTEKVTTGNIVGEE